MSELKVNKITPKTGTSIQLGESGDTITIPCGATLTNNGTATGFGLSFCTTVKTSPFTATANKGFLINTGSAVTVTLPASPSTGDEVIIVDQTGQAATNNITLGRNGSKIKGKCSDGTLSTNRGGVRLVYSGSSQGWITATAGNDEQITQTYNVQYLVVAGGGGGGATCGGNGGGSGGGAGGYRVVSSKSFSITGGSTIPVTVGAGGSAGAVPSSYPAPTPSFTQATSGSNSIFSTITSAGGGYGSFAKCSTGGNGADGGSGGGASGGPSSTGGAGNTPPVSPPQGSDGGDGGGAARGSGGGGASAVGLDGSSSNGYTGGAGSNTTILGSIPQAPSYGEAGPNPGRYFAGGGGGGLYSGSPEIPSGANNGGLGGGGNGGIPGNGTAGSTNMGAGGGGGGRTAPAVPSQGGAGGSGIVILRYVTNDASPSHAGGNVTATCGSDTIRIFTSDGTFTS